MGVIIVIFAIMSYFYVYITPQGYDVHQGDEHGLIPTGNKDEDEGDAPKSTAPSGVEGSYQGGGEVVDPNQ